MIMLTETSHFRIAVLLISLVGLSSVATPQDIDPRLQLFRIREDARLRNIDTQDMAGRHIDFARLAYDFTESSKAKERLIAVRILGAERSAKPRLSRMVDDPDDAVRTATLRLLSIGLLLSDAAELDMSRLRKALDDPNLDCQAHALDIWTILSPQIAIPYALRSLESSHQTLRKAAIASLVQAGKKEALPLLLEELSGSTSMERLRWLDLLKRFGPEGYIALSKRLGELQGVTRLQAIETLAWSKDQSILALLRSVAEQGAERERQAVLESVADFAIEIWERLIGLALKSKDPNTRESAVYATRSLPNEVALEILRQAVRDPDGGVRARAADLIACNWVRKEQKLLLDLLQDPDPRVARSIVDAVVRNELKGGETLLVATLSLLDKPARVRACWGLTRMPTLSAQPGLAQMARSGDAELVMPAVRALAAMGSLIHEEIRGFAKHSDPLVRAAVMEGLMYTRLAWVDRLAEKLTKDPDSRVRRAALDALLESSADLIDQKVELFRNALRDPSPEIRALAAVGLLSFEPVLAQKEVRALLQDASPLVRERVARTLKRHIWWHGPH